MKEYRILLDFVGEDHRGDQSLQVRINQMAKEDGWEVRFFGFTHHSDNEGHRPLAVYALLERDTPGT